MVRLNQNFFFVKLSFIKKLKKYAFAGEKKIKPIIIEVNETNMELIQHHEKNGDVIYDMPGEFIINIIYLV